MGAFLVTSDLHFTSQVRDEYRWQLFPWLAQQIAATGATHLLILGDLTDAKDHHPAALVNRLCDNIAALSQKAAVVVLKGNHDFIDQNTPFFGFLSGYEGVKYIATPKFVMLNGARCLFLPAVKDHQVDWPNLPKQGIKYIFAHATFDGAEVENGTTIGGVPLSCLDGVQGECISGDVHVPQKLGRRVTYVGAPYHVHFGDSFDPRVLLIDDKGKLTSIPTAFPRRPVVTIREVGDLDACQVARGDQVKIRVELVRAQYAEWPNMRAGIKEAVTRLGWTLCGLELLPFADQKTSSGPVAATIDPKDIILTHAKRKKLAKAVRDIGLSLIERA